MLDFVCVILPGIFLTFVVEALLRKKFSVHDFLFLAVANIILLNFFSLGIRHFVVQFIFVEPSQLNYDESVSASAFLKYMEVTGVVGVAMGLLEAFLCNHVSLYLENTKAKDGQKK